MNEHFIMKNAMNHNHTIPPDSVFTFIVTKDNAQTRLDTFISHQFSHYSRSFFQRLIEGKFITVNDRIVTKAGLSLKEGDRVTITFPPKPTIPSEILEADLGVIVLYEHDHFFIIFKPAGLMVHPPSEFNNTPTLVHWLTHHHQGIKEVGYVDRPGIVHRLDKDTSGLMVIPRTNYAFMKFGELFRSRTIAKTYLALVEGHPDREGTIDMPIGRDKVTRTKMKAYSNLQPDLSKGIRHAITHYKVLEYFDNAALVEIKPVTGRTHQIRAHFSAIGHPIIGDKLYGHSSPLINHHALHATGLTFTFDGVPYTFSKEPPEDFMQAIEKLKKKSRTKVKSQLHSK